MFNFIPTLYCRIDCAFCILTNFIVVVYLRLIGFFLQFINVSPKRLDLGTDTIY